MPGLAEMHGHLPNPDAPGASPELTESVLFLYLANGVTVVRGMQGNPAALELRDRIARGEVLGPRLWVAGQPLSGNSVRTAAAGRRLVEAQRDAGFDLIKIHEGLKRDVYDTIAATAKRIAITLAGHVPDDVGLFRALEAGQVTIDHLDNYVEAAGGDSLDATGIARVVQATRHARAWVVPTMALWETFLAGDVAALSDLRELRYVPAQWVDTWTRQLGNIRRDNPDVSAAMREIAARRRILKALADSGAGILLGTDSPQIFSVPGFSLHREVESMAAAGMTPYAILASGTRRVAEYFGSDGDFGTIAQGKRADLVLLSGNPLESLGNLTRPAGVMVSGRWLPREELDRRLDQIAQRYQR
jgi:imidazolonepropionase-like amidohydrolase